MQCILDVVGRTAVESATFFRYFIDLCQRAFNKTGGSADNGDDPHPKNSPRTAQNDGNRYAGNIADTYAAGGTEHKTPETKKFLCLFGLLPAPSVQNAKHFTCITNLNKAGTKRKIKAKANQ